jgi:hypothetical protein
MVWVGPVMAQPKWLGLARPPFKKKSKKNSKTILKKIVIFLAYFSTNYA